MSEPEEEIRTLQAENRRLQSALKEHEESIEALVEAYEEALVERDGWKFAVEERRQGPMGRMRRYIRVRMIGLEDDGACR